MSKLPKPPFEFNLSRKRNNQPVPTKSTATITAHLNTANEEHDFEMTDSEEPKIGDRVLVDGRHLYGTLRYLGPTDFKSGKWAGVELDHQGTGKNDGSVQGIYYFNCAANTGIFVPCSKITLVSRCLTTLTNSNKPYVNTSSLSLSSPSPSPSTVTSMSRSSSSVPTAYPSPQTPTLKKPHLNKNSQRTAVNTNVTPSSSVVESKHVEQEYHIQRTSQRYDMQQRGWIDDNEKRYQMIIERHQQEVSSYQVKLGREQHRVYELRKEREHLVQQIYQSNQQITLQDQITQQWQQSQDKIQHLEESNRQQAAQLDQLNKALEQAQSHHRKESAQLLEQQSQLIQELQRERYEHDSIKTTMRHVEQACQGLMDPFDVRPGLGLVDQLKETQRQVKDLLEKVRLDTDQKQQQRRDINALHRDVANLESLIETKLFNEADLMESVELERQRNLQLQNELKSVKQSRRNLEKKNNRHHSSIITNTTNNSNIKKKHVLSLDSGMAGSRWTHRSGETIATSTSYDDDDDDDDDDDLPSYCEMCETVGHDLMSCTVADPSEKHKVGYPIITSASHMNTTPMLQQKLLPSL